MQGARDWVPKLEMIPPACVCLGEGGLMWSHVYVFICANWFAMLRYTVILYLCIKEVPFLIYESD